MKSVLIAALLSAGSLAGQGSIEGQAFNAATGAPLKKVTVRLNALNSGQNKMPVAMSKETDDQGNFAFAGLDPGRYGLSAQRLGFLRQSYGARHFNTSGIPIPLAQDQHIKSIVLKLSPQSVIAGKVLDEDGEPLGNVQVRALKFVYRSGKKEWSQVGNGQSSDIGEYRIANLDPGRYLVEANPRNNGEMTLSPNTEPLPAKPETVRAGTYYPNALDSGSAAPVEVGPGAELRGIDINIRKVEAYRVRGQVVAPIGSGRVTVMLSPKEGGNPIQNMSMARMQDNRFEIRGVPPGSYIAHARLGNGMPQLIAFQPVEVGHNHVDGVVLTMSGGIDIQGVVKVAESDAQVTMTNANVNLRPVGFLFGGGSRVKVGEDRKFTLRNVMPERFTVNFSGVPDNCFIQSIKYAGQEVTEAGVEPNGNGVIEVILSATAGQVTGSVGDKDGKPVAGAVVALFSKSTPSAQPRNSFADENGSFTFKGLKPGDYKLLAWEDVEPGASMDPEFVKPWESRAAEVKIEPSGTQAVQLKVISAEETAK